MIERDFNLGLLFGAAALAITAGCGHKPSPPGQPAALSLAVTTAKPERKTVTLSTTQPGQIEAFEQTPLFAKVAGYVEELMVDIGDRVKKDQVLLRISVPELLDELHQKEALVAQAKAEVKQAESAIEAAKAAADTAQSPQSRRRKPGLAERRRMSNAGNRNMHASKNSPPKDRSRRSWPRKRSMSCARQKPRHAKQRRKRSRPGPALTSPRQTSARAQADQVAAEARLQVAQAGLERANTMVAYTKIRAPYDGTVTRRMVDTGHYVYPASGAANKPLLVLARIDVVRIYVDVPELEASHVDAGDRATVRVQAVETKQFDAQVTRTGWTLLESNHSLRAEIDVPNPDGLLRPGMYATVTIRLDERPDVITLPVSAIVREGGNAFCWCVDSARIDRRQIQLGLRSGAEIEVISGLDGNEVVVVKQPEALRQGQMVQVASPAK